MFEHLFKKDTPLAPESSPTPVNADAQHAPSLSAEETQVWQDRIAAASDDTTKLQLAHAAPSVPLKLAAIEALTLEASFKQAMHDFREHDKRLYRAAKSRYETAHGRRIATEEGSALVASARTLLEAQNVPVNRVVELDHAWAALHSEWVDAVVRAEFSALSEQLGGHVRQRSERGQAITRWLSTVDQAMATLSAALPEVARGEVAPTTAEPHAVALLELVQALPDASDAKCAAKAEVGNRLLAVASSVVQRAAFLLTLPAAGQADEDEKQLIEQWRSFPEMAENDSDAWHTALAARFAEWRNVATQERASEQAALSTEEREKRREQNKQRMSAIARDIAAAELAHSEGHMADLTRLLGTIDHALKRGAVNAALNQRIEVLRAEQRRLQDWQRWGGKQGREQLVIEAQTLAVASAGKVAIKTHTEAIDKLRERWKELDKLGAASNQVMWLTFDGALKTAYVPVSAHLEKLKAERNENLAKREQIVDALQQAVAKYFTPPATDSVAAKPDWRAVSHALEEGQQAWRKLGPVEHTVPRKAQKGEHAVTTRYAAAVQALNAPLKTAYSDARSQREALIASAKTLAESDVTARDVVDKVRKIQTQWQAVAKANALPRRDENALWGAFKTATDAIFTGRDAARAAQEVEANAKQQVRMEIIDRVTALTSLTAAADIKRALADAESAWRAAPEAPRAQAAKLDARYRAAREAASKHVAELGVQAEQVRYDALIAATALCAERESATAPDETLQARWDGLEHLPAPWKTKLDARFQGKTIAPPPANKKNAGERLPDTLLNLEVACSINSPEAFQAARQFLKIRALKTAMEGRQATTATTPADIERWMLEAAASPRPDDISRERLALIIAAVRRRPSR